MASEKTKQRNERSALSKFQMTLLFQRVVQYAKDKLEERVRIPFKVKITQPGLTWDCEILQKLRVKVLLYGEEQNLFRLTLAKYHRSGNSFISFCDGDIGDTSRIYTWKWKRTGTKESIDKFYQSLCEDIDFAIEDLQEELD